MSHGTVTLRELPVLIVDCQATGTSPKNSHLLEVAWSACCADDEAPTVESLLVRLPDDVTIPKRVTRLTGIDASMLADAPDKSAVAEAFEEMLSAWEGACALAHFARYERGFLSDLLARDDLDFLCTHEIAKRMLPGLPRKGLRPVAGYLGRTVDEAKRAGEHVDATHFVWREMVARLEAEGIVSPEQLWRWLEEPPPKATKRTYALPRETRLALPDEPGVYRMLAGDRSVLYVGKATSLKARVNSYFRQRKLANDKMELVSQVHDIEVTTTPTALEAALLEADEIKRLAPRYNHLLRERDIVWASPDDFRDLSNTRTERHTVGPLPSRATCTHFADAIDVLSERGAAEWLRGVEPGILAAGIEAFRTKWDVRSVEAREFVELGARIFPTLEAREDEEDDVPSVTAVTEETIVRYLEWSAAGAYRSTRRAKWLRELSTSVVSWAPHGARDRRRSIALQAGEVVGRDSGRLDLRPEPSPTVFDSYSYDRLSVLLIELRRILRDERAVEVETCDDAWGAPELRGEFERF